MRIKHLEIKNWGPHKHRAFDMSSSIVGIIGANGKGKSNLLQAIDYALTGNLNKQKQEKYIRNFGQPNGATSASVHLVFEKDGKTGEITRTITATGSRRSLKWDDQEWTKAADVERILEEILGADKASLAQAVFIKQGELARIIKGTPAERQTLFQKLMNLSFIETRAEDITSKICAIRGTLQDMRPTLELALNDLQACELDMADLKDAANKRVVYQNAISQLEALIYNLQELQHAAAALPDAQTQHHNAQVALAIKMKELNTNSIEAMKESMYQLKRQLEDAQHKLDKCRYYRSQLAERERILNVIEFQKKELKAKFSYVTHEDYFFDKINELKVATQAVLDKRTKIASAKAAADRILVATKKYEREAELVAEYKKTAEEEIPELKTQLQELAAEIAQLTIDIAYTEAKEAIFDAGIENTTICPICGTEMNVNTISLPGESVEDTKDRLRSELQKLQAQKLSATQTTDSISARLLACQQTLALPDPKIAYEAEIAEDKALLESDVGAFLTQDAKAALEEYNKLVDQSTRYATERAQYVTIKDIIDSYEAKLAKLPKLDIPDYIEDETKLILTVNELTAKVATAQGNINVLEQLNRNIALAESNLETVINNHAFRKTIFNSDLADAEADEDFVSFWLSVDPDEAMQRNSLTDLTKMLNLAREAKTEVDQDAAKYKQLAEQKDKLLARISALKEIISKNEAKQTLIDDLNVAKSMISRTGVPLAFMNDVFNKLVSMIQDILTRMGSNFNVIPDPDHACSFLFVRTDNDSSFAMQQEQLSGGQAIRLALALLLSCQQLILPEIGLLVLDEPSSHIDSEGVEQMRDLFISLQQLLQNTDMQLIIVDHNDKLTTSFETTIVL